MISPPTGSTPSAYARSEPRGKRWVELIHGISRCHRLMRDALNALASRWKVNDTEFLVLWLSERAGADGIAQAELVVAIGASAARISGMVEDLRQRGLLVSHRSQKDRRRQLWRPTAEGTRILHHVCQTLAESPAAAGANISISEQKMLFDLLRRLTNSSDNSTGLALFTEDPPSREPCTEAHHENAHRRAV
jgi:DNA-binding MarR family transcriptional regulator